ncbi:RnfABCDGE type electron transport complex subunit B, partial [Staphylococcus aureus]|uniref:RnfABCDGE type electron transport complex subunit B n=1 Tax=Staphylococcus aureus TaxID=1280 RepID=UPI001614651A
EDECIGCTKCINACPVDAIIGSGKLMHTILTDLCTGCELCIPPCPVDCIDGCLPYAKSIAEGEEANKCVPGGQPVADALAQLLNRPLLPAETSVWPVQLMDAHNA